MTLVEFLNARLDEDEAVVKEAIAALERDPDALIDDGLGWYANNADSSGDSIVAVGPRRGAAEVEAKRRIVNDYLACLGTNPGTSVAGHPVATAATLPVLEVAASTVQRGAAIAFERVLRDLALPYAGHPDYDPDWKS